MSKKNKIGVIGAGQLAGMLADAARTVGLELLCLSPDEAPCADGQAQVISAAYSDTEAQQQIIDAVDVVTYETENLPLDALEVYAEAGLLKPSLRALELTRDRLAEKNHLRSCGIETAPFLEISTDANLKKAAVEGVFPAILKTRSGGYDGKGQASVDTAEQLAEAWASLGQLPCILEGKVTFQRELSIIAARSTTGEFVAYPLTENLHRDGILRFSVVRLGDDEQQAAEQLVNKLMADLDYAGVMTVELFDSNGELIANEIAPRVHNSGHWTIEGAAASQFLNHVLAITGQALVPPAVSQRSVMANLIGNVPDSGILSQSKGAVRQHIYGKSPRPGRKLGHVTLAESDIGPGEDFEQLAAAMAEAVGEQLPN